MGPELNTLSSQKVLTFSLCKEIKNLDSEKNYDIW